MPSTRRIEFVQRKFTRPNVEVFQRDGDFDYSYNLIPNPVGHGLRRAPAWSSHVQFPSGFTNCRGMFWDCASSSLVFIGTKNNHLATVSMPFDTGVMGTATEIDTGTATLGEISMHNYLWWHSYLYYIRSDRTLYKSLNFTATGTVVYSNQDARCLTVVGDRPVFADTSGELHILNRSATFEHMWYVATGLDVRYMVPMDGSLVIFARGYDGDMHILTIRADPSFARNIANAIAQDPSLLDLVNPDVSHIATVQATGDLPRYGSLFARHDDEIYFAAGRAKGKTFVHRFNGSHVELADEIPYTTTSSETDGLLDWQDQLIFYSLDTGINYLRVWMGEGFTYLTNKSFTFTSPFAPCAAATGPTIAITDNPDGNEGIYYLTRYYSPDASLFTSHLDLGHPGKLKRLNRIVITFNYTGSLTAKCRVDYTLDQGTSLVMIQDATAISEALVIEPTSHIEFYTIQLKLTFSDTATGTMVNNIVPETVAIAATGEA